MNCERLKEKDCNTKKEDFMISRHLHNFNCTNTKMIIQCPDCPLYPIKSLHDYGRHRSRYHQNVMVCLVSQCPRNGHFTDIKTHMFNSHPEVFRELKSHSNTVATISSSLDCNYSVSSHGEQVQQFADDSDDEGNIESEDLSNEDFQTDFDQETRCSSILKKSVGQLLQTKERFLINDVQFMKLVSAFLDVIKSVANHEEFDYIIENIGKVSRSTWNMNAFIKSNYPYSEPMPRILSGKLLYQVSIKSIIARKLQDSKFASIILEAQKHQRPVDGSISSFRDTQTFIEESQTLFYELADRRNQLALFGELYVDGFQLANPIGPFKGCSSITGVYMNFPDVKRRHRMRRKDQCLVALIPTESIDDSGYTLAYHGIKEELKELETDGFTQQIMGNSYRIKFVVIKFCGDNKGIFELLGKVVCFTSGSICRTCTATYEGIQLDPYSGVMRTKETWQEDIENLIAGNLVEGMRAEPVFYGMKYFPICNQYPGDRLHNLLLGVYPDTIELIFKDFVTESNIDLINDTIRDLKLTNGSPEVKIVAGSRNGRTLKGSGSQNYDIFLNLPELMFKFVSRIHGCSSTAGRHKFWSDVAENPRYKLYMILRRLDCFIRQESFSSSDLNSITMLVRTFFQRRANCVGNQTVTSKIHYLVHITHEIKTHGPIMNYDNLAYERKHSTFIRKINTIKCRKSISKLLLDWDARLTAISDCTDDMIRTLGSKKRLKQSDRVDLSLVPDESIFHVQGVRIDNCEWKVGQIRKHGRSFILIKWIVNIEDEYCIFGELYDTLSLDDDFHAYKVKLSGDQLTRIMIKDMDSLNSPLRKFSIDQTLYINKIDH